MKFKLYTLVDMTETGEHRGIDYKKTNQQSNYNTVIQTLNLRTNIIPVKLSKILLNTSEMKFGTEYNGRHMVWSFLFDVDYGLHCVDHMVEDFTLVPIILNLDETAPLKKCMFDTFNKQYCNIIFEEFKYE